MPRVDYRTYSLVGRICQELLEQIMRGQTDATLSESKLAKRFNTSKTPIREALQRLSADGIVAATPKRGWQVRVPSLRELRDLFVVRVVLEGLAASEAAANATEAELKELTNLAGTEFVVGDPKSFRDFVWNDYLFHNAIAKASHNSVLETHVRVVLGRIQIALAEDDKWADPSVLAEGQQMLLESLKRREAGEARAAMDRVIGATMEQFLAPPASMQVLLENW